MKEEIQCRKDINSQSCAQNCNFDKRQKQFDEEQNSLDLFDEMAAQGAFVKYFSPEGTTPSRGDGIDW